MKSQTQLVEQLFKSHPNTWLSALDIVAVVGPCGWRTRVSDARQVFRRDGGDIENRLETHGQKKYSYYRYVPPTAPQMLVGWVQQ